MKTAMQLHNQTQILVSEIAYVCLKNKEISKLCIQKHEETCSTAKIVMIF